MSRNTGSVHEPPGARFDMAVDFDGHHSNRSDIDADVLPTGVKTLLRVATDTLVQPEKLLGRESGRPGTDGSIN